jgi:hypothetical protein
MNNKPSETGGNLDECFSHKEVVLNEEQDLYSQARQADLEGRAFFFERSSDGNTFEFLHLRDWESILFTAILYDWKPLGTINRECLDWSGSYLDNCHQTITQEDALNLAEALSKSIEDNFQRLIGTRLRTDLIQSMACYFKRGSCGMLYGCT